MFFAANLGGVSTLWPKAAILRAPPLKVFLAASLTMCFIFKSILLKKSYSLYRVSQKSGTNRNLIFTASYHSFPVNIRKAFIWEINLCPRPDNFRGYLKSKVFMHMPNSIYNLNNRNQHEVQQLNPDMITRACRESLRSRLERLLLRAGGYIELYYYVIKLVVIQ